MTDGERYRRGWLAAAAVFLLASATGAWMRFGLLSGFPDGIEFANVRHAHSHVMYFGWVTPALIGLIAVHLPAVSGRPASDAFRLPVALAVVCGLLAYVPFLLFGYAPASVAGRAIPLSVLAATLNVFVWYLFALRYRRATRGLAVRPPPLRLWDGAVLLLLGATAGTWGLPLLTRLAPDNAVLAQLFTRIFLDLFSEGWFVLGLLGVVYARHPQVAGHPRLRPAIDLVLIGAPFIFLFNMPTAIIFGPLRWIASLGAALLAGGVLLHLSIIWPATGTLWRIPLFFLGAQAIVKLIGILPDGARWATQMGLRIPYLHWLLLGWVSLGIFVAAHAVWGRRAVPLIRLLALAICVHIAALLPLTRLFPAAWKGSWGAPLAAWTAAATPVVVGAGLVLVALRKRLHPPGS